VSGGDAGFSSPRRRVGDLSVPVWIAHRGMANVYPEDTLEAYRGAVALGVEVVEPDCWLTRDGGLVCLHDATVDRTTDGSGNTDELTLPGAESLHVDAGRWFAPAWPNTLRVPTFSEVLDDLDGQALLCPEAKNTGAGGAIVDRLTQHGRLDAAILQSFTQAELRPAVAAGGAAMMLTATSLYDPAALYASGIRYLGLSAALPPSLVSPARAAGLEVMVWVVNRRVDAQPWLAAGAIGLFSDDPLYLSGRSPLLTCDPFRHRTYYHGHLASSIAGDRGTFCAPHAWGYTDIVAAYKGALQGWASPIAGADDGYGLTFTMQMDAAANPDGWAGAFFCAADDRSFDDVDRYQPGLGGYLVLLRQSGSLEFCIVNHGIATPASRATTPPLDPGATATLRIEVAPTQVAVTRVGLESATVITVADSSHRGGYVHLGRRAAAVRFLDIAVS
jgi:glycerophosphoryl diester phosphodiesterase